MITPYDKRNYLLGAGEGSEAGRFSREGDDLPSCHRGCVRVLICRRGQGLPLPIPKRRLSPESMARRMFGGEPAVGRQIHFKESRLDEGRPRPDGGGRLPRFPGEHAAGQAPSTPQSHAPYRGTPTEWGGSNWLCYLLLDSPESARAVDDNFNRTFDFSQIWGCEHLHLRLLPLEDLHYMNMQDVWGSSLAQGRKVRRRCACFSSLPG